MKAIPLEVQVRSLIGKKVKSLRRDGLVPATVYGKEVKSQSLAVPVKEFAKVFAQAGETGLVELKFDKTTLPTLISEVQIHPLNRQLLHVQFHAVKLTEKIKANVPLELVGESPAVTSNIGLLLQTLNEIEVEALPTDLPEKIEVDTRKLSEVDQQITVADLKIPGGVEVLTGKEEVVVKVAPAVSEEAKKEAEEEAAKAAAEAATEGAGEAVAPAEGESPKAETPAGEKAS
ncbi:50S ribosomal protein L25 [Patescibacteria group bacterium]|nr:50S ribosomal protein L25 [Patescibacteria group bacterium]